VAIAVLHNSTWVPTGGDPFVQDRVNSCPSRRLSLYKSCSASTGFFQWFPIIVDIHEYLNRKAA